MDFKVEKNYLAYTAMMDPALSTSLPSIVGSRSATSAPKVIVGASNTDVVYGHFIIKETSNGSEN